MAFIDTIKALFGSAWHVNSDAIHTAMWPAADGTVEANKPVVVDANKKVDTLDHTTLKIGGVAVTATAAEINAIAGAGLSAGELGVLDGVTAGTVIASKAMVTDAGIKITGLLNCTYGAGTATVAPVNYTAGTNLTTAAVGAAEFDGSVHYLTAVASARQVVDTEQFICLTANYSATDTASAQKVFNSPTNGALTVAALTSYMFEAEYIISNTGTTSHTWATLFALGGGATLTSIAYTALARTGTTTAVTITALSSLQVAVATQVPVTAASTSATEFVIIRLRGIIRVNAAGTITPQIQASAQPGATGTPGVTVLAGSFFRCWPVGSNTVASVGNWS